MSKHQPDKDYTWEFVGVVALSGVVLWFFAHQPPATASAGSQLGSDLTQGVTLKVDTDLATDLAIGALGGTMVHAAFIKPIVRTLAGRLFSGHSQVKMGPL